MRTASDRSAATAARPGSDSVRTTIPAFVVKKMGLVVGDALEWDVGDEDGRRA